MCVLFTFLLHFASLLSHLETSNYFTLCHVTSFVTSYPGQPGLAGGIPVHGRGLELDDL